MDLVKIGFIVTANGLKEANAEVDKLLNRVDKIGTSSKKNASEFENSQKKIKKTTEDSTKAAETNTGKQQSEETQDKKRETYRRNWDKNQISAQRQSWVTYRIEGKTYVGNKAVMEAFGITEPTIYNRVNNPKFNWERLNG